MIVFPPLVGFVLFPLTVKIPPPPLFSVNSPLFIGKEGMMHDMGEVSRVWCIGMVCYGESDGRYGATWLLVWPSMAVGRSVFFFNFEINRL